MRIQSSGGLNDEQIDKMVREAETFAAADKLRKELIEVRTGSSGFGVRSELVMS